MESWIIKQAYVNSLTPHTFAKYYLMGVKGYGDFDFIDRESPAFARIAAAVGRARAQEMLFDSYIPVLGKSWKFWTIPWRSVGLQRRFCPECFNTDKTPYLRLTWRLSFMNVCLKHNRRMLSNCKCGASFQPRKLPSMGRGFVGPQAGMGVCPHCRKRLGDSPAPRVSRRDTRYRAAAGLLRLAENRVPIDDSLGYSPEQTFELLRYLLRFFERIRKKGLGIRRKGGKKKLENGEAYDSIGQVWPYLINPKELESLFREHQPLFNRTRFPAILNPILNRYLIKLDSSHRARISITWDEVWKVAQGEITSRHGFTLKGLAVKLFRARGRPLPADAAYLRLFTHISSEQRNSLQKLSKNSILQRELDVLSETIGIMHVGQVVTLRDIERILGRSQEYVRTHPEFTAVIKEARAKTQNYILSMRCMNPKCSDRDREVRNVRLALKRKQYGGLAYITLFCRTCNQVRQVNVKETPLRRDYVQSVTRMHVTPNVGRK